MSSRVTHLVTEPFHACAEPPELVGRQLVALPLLRCAELHDLLQGALLELLRGEDGLALITELQVVRVVWVLH